MKSLNDTNQFLITNQINLKKQNTKSYFFQNKTNDSSSREKNKNPNLFIKNKIGKSIIFKEKKSKEKISKSNSLSKDKMINKNLLKFPDSINFENNTLLTNRNKSTLKLNTKIYEKVIDKLFFYMKNILPLETYENIKNKFILDFKQEIININNQLNISNQKENKSSLSNIIKKTILNISNNNNKIFSPKNIKNEKNKISSLYSLKKRYNKNISKTTNNSINKSKETNYSLSKGIIENNKIKLSKKRNDKYDRKYTLVNTKIMLNSKLFQKLKDDYIKLDLGNKTMRNKKNKKTLLQISINNLKTIHNRNLQVTNISESNSQSISNSINKKNNKFKLNKSLYFSNIKKKTKNILNNDNKKIINNNNQLNNKDNYINNDFKNNSEQLKVIKSSLDDNLKVMFNFSYECFLNKESESQSKKSFEDTFLYNDNNHNINNI